MDAFNWIVSKIRDKTICKNVQIGEIKMELRNKNTDRCTASANESQRSGSLAKFVAAELMKLLRSHFALIDNCATNCELMTFKSSEVESRQIRCRRNGTCDKLTLSENAIHDKMVANRSDQSDENRYVYFVNNSGEQCTTKCKRRPTNRTNGNGSDGSKSKIRQLFRGHSISVLILIIFSLGLVDMVNGESTVLSNPFNVYGAPLAWQSLAVTLD